jgi:hypothetical protein
MNRCESCNIVLPSLCGNCQAKASARHKCDWITSKKTGTFCKWCGITKPENACKHEWSYMDMSCLKCGITKPENAKKRSIGEMCNSSCPYHKKCNRKCGSYEYRKPKAVKCK